jgi:branched-chain amino acid transport system substrate-binding protein
MTGFGPSGIAGLTRRAALGIGATVSLSLFAPCSSQAAEPIKVGLVTALSGQSARAGEALTRGLAIAIDEINAKGGILGRQVELVRRDDEANPAKGVIAARELVQREKVAVLFGGLDTPVALAIVPFTNGAKVPLSTLGLPAPTSPITAPTRTTPSGSLRWTNQSTRRWSVTR